MALPKRKARFLSEPRQISLDHASTAASLTTKVWKVPAGRSFRIRRVFYNNPTGLAANASNYFDIRALNAALIAAKWSTQTGVDGTLTADTPVDLVNSATDSNLVLPAGTTLSFAFILTGAATLPAGRVVLEGDLL